MTVTGATFDARGLREASRPTFYFVGVSTARSSIRRVFPLWAEELDLGPVDLVGIDLPIHAPRADYRRVVDFLRDDPLSRGALVTTHKLDLFRAARDLFDESDELALLMHEVSCISKRGDQLRAHAKDPVTAGFAVDAILDAPARRDRSVLLLGAGGSAIALAWHLAREAGGGSGPRGIVVSDPLRPRLDSFADVYAQFGGGVPLRVETTSGPADNDRLLESLPSGALVVNATGLGKDAPGSPLSDAARFPQDAHAWDLNYRGDLVFLDQARAQRSARGLTVHDGWVYFVHGWTRVIAEVFDVEIPTSGPGFERLSEIAASARGGG